MYNYITDITIHKKNIMKMFKFIFPYLNDNFKNHDKSKLYGIEKNIFSQNPPPKNITYRSDEYNDYIKLLEPAKKQHYKLNPHHIEHHHNNNIANMNLFQLIEMISDWYVSIKYPNTIYDAIEINQKYYGYSDEIKSILINTVNIFDRNHVQDSLTKYKY